MITITLTKAEELALLHAIERTLHPERWYGVRLGRAHEEGIQKIITKLEKAEPS